MYVSRMATGVLCQIVWCCATFFESYSFGVAFGSASALKAVKG